MTRPLPLKIWDRETSRFLLEFMDDSRSTYESNPRRSFNNWLESHPTYDWLVAAYQNTRLSARKIQPFIERHKIDMSEFEPKNYRTYAEFFDRKFRPGLRTFPVQNDLMGAFAEARYFAWASINGDQTFPIKAQSLSARAILNQRAEEFIGGPVILARLSPVDYHHLHYPDDGTTVSRETLGGRLWTVNKNALLSSPDILMKNERSINILATKHFGLLAFIEVGALSVGRIVQVHPIDQAFRRGEEKSVFRFGGSAVIVFGQRGRWMPSEDLLEKTSEGFETFVKLGQPIACR